MSLILDALKKSEAERQRQSGPTLLEVRVSAPRRRYPTWVIAVAVLLAINILLLLIFALRRPAPAASDDIPAPALASAPSASSHAPVVPVAAPSVAPAASPAAAPTLSSAAEADLPAAGGRNAARANDVGAPEPLNPADNEPAVPAGAAATEREPPSRYAGLPSYTDLGGDAPSLRLDLHVYAQRPADRYALINMHRLREGDALPEGPRVLAITREGVALEFRGQQFMLRPQ
jgi:general secretion pathway protein B